VLLGVRQGPPGRLQPELGVLRRVFIHIQHAAQHEVEEQDALAGRARLLEMVDELRPHRLQIGLGSGHLLGEVLPVPLLLRGQQGQQGRIDASGQVGIALAIAFLPVAEQVPQPDQPVGGGRFPVAADFLQRLPRQALGLDPAAPIPGRPAVGHRPPESLIGGVALDVARLLDGAAHVVQPGCQLRVQAADPVGGPLQRVQCVQPVAGDDGILKRDPVGAGILHAADQHLQARVRQHVGEGPELLQHVL